MALWELDEFLPPTFLGFVRSVPIPQDFIGQRWLPNDTTDDLEFGYIKGVNRKTVMAHVIGFDSEAPIAGRPALGQRVEGELPPIKRKARISEKEISRFLQPRTGTSDVQTAVRSVYGLTGDLIDAVQARIEWLRMQALTEDKVIYDENGIIFQFDYGLNNKFQIDLVTGLDGDGTDVSALVGPSLDQVATADPLKFLRYICDLIGTTTGVRPGEWTVSQKTIGYLLENVKLRELIRGPASPTATLTVGELNTILDIYSLPTISTYDAMVFKEEANGDLTQIRLMAENKSFFTPSGISIGNTLLGPTAESRVLFGTPLAAAAPGVWANTWGEEEPPAEWTKACAVAFPTMPDGQFLGQAKLYA